MDASRCVVIEFDGTSQEPLIRYLSKNSSSYNWIVTAFGDFITPSRVCVWWTKNVEFSTTPLRSFLKCFKNKMTLDSYFKISRKMSTQEGVRKVYGGNGPTMISFDTLQRSSSYYLTNPVREHVIGLRLQEPNNEELVNFFEPSKEEPSKEEPSNEEVKVDDSTKLDLLLKIAALISTSCFTTRY